jgi:uncharacterized membrane protein/predicted DsbA family dithiol-disulfide isomerase
MRPSPAATVLNLVGPLARLVPAVVGLCASSILAVDYLHASPVFCSEGGGCDAIRHSAFASFLGIPTPFFGLGGFLAIGVATLVSGRTARALQLGLGAIAAIAGIALLAIQVRLGHFCPYCVAADSSAALAFVVAIFDWRAAASAPPVGPPLAAVVGCGVVLAVAVAGPFGAALLVHGGRAVRLGPVPDAIKHELAQAGAGEVAVIDFVDFECPFCRQTNAELEPLLAAHQGRIHLVRRQVPLRIHPHARDAARAACCGEALGQGEAMAKALFRTDVNELTPEGCEQVASRVGVPLAAYRACVADPRTDARIDADRQEFNDAGGFALPTIWFGDQAIVGAQPASALAGALDRALRHVGG